MSGRILAAAWVCLVVFGGPGIAREQPAPSARPNVVLMFPDNLG